MRYITAEESFEVCRDYNYKLRDPFDRVRRSKVLDLVATLKIGDGVEVLRSDWDLVISISKAIHERLTKVKSPRFEVTPIEKKSTGELGWYIHRYK